MTQRCFTLLETLAVVVLLSLATGSGLSTLHRALESPGAVLDHIRQIDAQMRLSAQSRGPMALTFVITDHETVLRSVSLRGGESHDIATFKRHISVIDADSPDTVTYDSLGRTADFSIRIEGADTVLNVAGLTGWIWESGGEGRP